MIISVKVSDDTYEKYGKHNKSNPRGAVEQVIERFADVGASGKGIVLNGENLAALQRLLGQIDSPEQIIERVTKIASVDVNGVPFPLSESQLKGIRDNSKFYGQTPEQFLQTKVKTALQNALGV